MKLEADRKQTRRPFWRNPSSDALYNGLIGPLSDDQLNAYANARAYKIEALRWYASQYLPALTLENVVTCLFILGGIAIAIRTIWGMK